MKLLRRTMSVSARRGTANFVAHTLAAYVAASDAIQGVARNMARIATDATATEDERAAALDTLLDSLFPEDAADV